MGSHWTNYLRRTYPHLLVPRCSLDLRPTYPLVEHARYPQNTMPTNRAQYDLLLHIDKCSVKSNYLLPSVLRTLLRRGMFSAVTHMRDQIVLRIPHIFPRELSSSDLPLWPKLLVIYS